MAELNFKQITDKLNEELDKIDNYTEQALFYARSNTVEKDYIVRKIQLKEIVNASILKNKAQLIQNKISIDKFSRVYSILYKIIFFSTKK